MSDETIDDGDQAFPPVSGAYRYGMSLRDWFAGMAISGLVSGVDCLHAKIVAQIAYEIADAMIKERKKERP